MAQPYVGEIRMFAGNFAPVGWEFCDGRLVPIATNDVLYTLIGTRYGGDGQVTFALPDLRGRLPIHYGNGFTMGIAGGQDEVVLTVSQIPAHRHALLANAGQGTTPNPGGGVVAGSPNLDLYVFDDANVQLSAQTVGPVGGSQPHTNLQPYLCVNFIISMFGIFPTPT